MPATTAYRQPTIPALPVSVPGKSPYYPPPSRTATYSRVSMSPPEAGSSMNTSAVPSLTSSTYGGSAASDYESSHGGSSGVDLIDMLNDRLSNAVDPIPLDRSLAKQAQTSGELNAKHRELLELQALAQRRLKGTRANFADGMKAAKEVKRDLEWTQKRVTALKSKAERKYPAHYRAASQQYPSPVDY
ncbi:MAG: hypothetical protein FRX48_01325 [Lasallia pustulata]|uniref:Biogenesis of lysosome-related organelles complex 1 subunit KXD1 n=1 Tax=Lasallia pustulata TaxID=136370 RepID=A0A5M8Q0S3_9LECA|nr:MAG: hypothetical protein FRX48_01325 [Lasallia pustulata]